MKKYISVLLTAALLITISGCSKDDESSALAEITDISQSTSTTTVEPSPSPEGEPVIEKQYSEGVRQLMDIAEFGGEFCEPDEMDIIVSRLTPDYSVALGEDALNPDSYDENVTLPFNGGEITTTISGEEQMYIYLHETVEYLFASGGYIYFRVYVDNTLSIYRIDGLSGEVSHVFTPDSMGYDMCYLQQANSDGAVWYCGNADGDERTLYCQSYNGTAYCLDSFLEQNEKVWTDLYYMGNIWYVDYVTVEFTEKSDEVPCIFKYNLADDEYSLQAFNAYNPRLCGGAVIWDSCAPSQLGFPFSDEYAVNTRLDTVLGRPMYVYSNHINDNEEYPKVGYLLEDENGNAIELFKFDQTKLWYPVSAVVSGCELAAASFGRIGHEVEDNMSSIAVLDYKEGKMTSVPIEYMHAAFSLSTILADSEMLYVPVDDGTIVTIRRRD